MKPRIAIISNQYEFAEAVFHHHPATFIPQFYVDAISKVGGLPFVVPLNNISDADDYVSQFDGFLLAGGQDISPVLYNEEPRPKIGETFLKRDQFEIKIIHAVQRTNKPLLGICRGQQVLNVALGGSLYQDLSYRKEPTIKHMQSPTEDFQPTHYVLNERPSFLKTIFGPKTLVNSLHHQAIKDLAPDLLAISHATDGVIEGVRSKNHQFFAVQWHPEMLVYNDERNYQIFTHLVQKADNISEVEQA